MHQSAGVHGNQKVSDLLLLELQVKPYLGPP